MADLVNNGQKRSAWSSKFGFLMAAVGSAVGLGNIWRFPYIAGQYGGAIFLIIYIIVVAVLGFSMLTLELVIGRNRNANVLDAFEMGKKKKITPIGWLCIFTPFLIVSYYNVIGGWIVKYLVGYIGGGGFVNDTGDYSAVFGNFISDPVWSSVFTVIFIALCAVVLILGVQKGIEKVSKVLMPALFFILVFVAIVSLTMDGALEGLKYLFVPNFESMEEYGILNILNAAMGQAFFSLSVGMGIAVTYGSYLKKDQNIAEIKQRIRPSASETPNPETFCLRCRKVPKFIRIKRKNEAFCPHLAQTVFGNFRRRSFRSECSRLTQG